MLVRSLCKRAAARGFSLIEVMVALVICGIGLLGLAKMEAVALSSTGVAAQRSLAAIQASSIAASMHANRDYWTVVSNTPIVISAAANPYAGVPKCTVGAAAPCKPADMANYDLQQWAQSLADLLPGYQGTISCPDPTPASVVSCAIRIQWSEGKVAADANQTFTSTPVGALNLPDYTLYVQP